MKYFTLFTPLALAVLVLNGCTFWNGVDTYEECVEAGYDVSDTNPPVCTTPDGDTFEGDLDEDDTTDTDTVRLTSPQPNDRISSSSITIEGEAVGNWFFEGVLPFEIQDDDGTVLLQESLQSEGTWMTEDFVSFEETFTLSVEEETDATLIIRRSNPSGLPENDEEFSIPITLVPDTTNNGNAQENWKTYSDSTLGISIDYPSEMTVDEGAEGPTATAGVSFMLEGPTQTQNTELFDGISVTIQRGNYEDTLVSFVQDQIDGSRQVGTITADLSQATIAGEIAFTYTAETLGTHTHYFVDVENGEYIHLYYSNPDPTQVGYDQTTQDMIASLEIQS